MHFKRLIPNPPRRKWTCCSQALSLCGIMSLAACSPYSGQAAKGLFTNLTLIEFALMARNVRRMEGVATANATRLVTAIWHLVLAGATRLAGHSLKIGSITLLLLPFPPPSPPSPPPLLLHFG